MAPPEPVLQTQECATAEPGLGCGQVFGLKAVPGLCGKCFLLQNKADDAIEQAHIKEWPQCHKCGLTYQHMPGELYGKCKHKDGQDTGEVQRREHERITHMQSRLKKGLVSLLPRRGPPTSGGLSRLKVGGATNSEKRFVNIVPLLMEGRLQS
ncbi:hypothetical protein JB92DRAFT_3121041 [Gautieria morchelliformis]|nr:hypothetical protein JB92DRAFT_3121041 [Gautieria morchelliformis]